MSAIPAPPGYASAEPGTEREPLSLPFPLAAFAAGLVSTLLLTFHELCLALPRAYALGGESSTLGIGLVLSGLLAGALAGRHARTPAQHAPTALALLSLLCAASGYGFLAAFAHPSALELARPLLPTLAAFGVGLASSLLLRVLGNGFVALGLLVHFLNPLRVALLGGSWLLVLSALPLLGLLRQGALIAALLAGLALLTPRVSALFAVDAASTRLGRALVALAPFVALTSLLSASWWISLAAVRSHTGEVVYALDGPRGEHVISKIQGGLVLFSNQVVATTSSDATRFAEALVHPALAIATERDHVLVLDDAAGAVTRETLRWPDVSHLTLVPIDPALLALARRSGPFRALGAAALDSPRVTIQTAEPSVFVLKARERYPLILANLADPSSYLSGKYYTVRFFEAVRERLAPGGIFALQITSPERTPRTHASILATLRQAGFATLPYRAPLPTLGEWGFTLAIAASNSNDGEKQLAERVRAVREVPAGTSLVTPQTLGALFSGAGAPPAPRGEPNFLYHQALLELYQDEERARSE